MVVAIIMVIKVLKKVIPRKKMKAEVVFGRVFIKKI